MVFIVGGVTLPIAQREMLVLAKSPMLYRSRVTSSIALLCLGICFGLIYHYAGLRPLGQVLPLLVFILLMICLFAGVHLTADSIAREKREGTIGLLLLTNLTPLQIVFGKLVAHALLGFYSVIIIVPLLSLIIIIGGLRAMEIGAIALAAMNILFFSAAIGLWASARHTDRKKAASSGTWVVVFFWWGFPVIVDVLNRFHAPPWLIDGVSIFSVNQKFTAIFTGGARAIDLPWVNVLVTHLMGWGFVFLAAWFLKHRWQEIPAKPRFSLREWWRQKSLGNARVRLRLQERLLERNPFLWLASRERLRHLGVWIFTVIMLGVIAVQFRYGWTASGGIFSMLITMCFVHKVMVAAMSAHQLGVEQEQGTLEMLLSTPLKTETVLRGQILATFRQFRGPLILWAVTHAAFVIAILEWEPFGRASDLAGTGLTVYGLIHLLELYAMAWAGMWGAVTVKEAKNAAGAAMARIVAMPALTFGLIASGLSAANWYLRLGMNFRPEIVVGFYFLLCIVNAFCWLAHTQRKLPGAVREYALRRYLPEQSHSIWSTMGRALGKAWRKQGAGAPPKLGLAGKVQS